MKRNNSYRRDSPSSSYLKPGTKVYFHVHKKDTPDKNFLCLGEIVRTPTGISNVYKIKITRVCTRTSTHGDLKDEAGNFLKKTYPVSPTGVETSFSSWMQLLYENAPWI
jgi:hypothetical protein